jgi:Rrf2 family protein
MLLSRSAEYAIRAMTFLARQPQGKPAGAAAIAQAEEIPTQFLWKILRNLTRHKLVRSFKGIGGGYQLALPANSINLGMIVDITDGSDFESGCVLGLAQCSEENACPLHHTWKELRGKMSAMLRQNTLATLAHIATRRATRHHKGES